MSITSSSKCCSERESTNTSTRADNCKVYIINILTYGLYIILVLLVVVSVAVKERALILVQGQTIVKCTLLTFWHMDCI